MAGQQESTMLMGYVDGYVLPVPKKNLNAYRRLAQQAAKIWRERGVPWNIASALVAMGLPFPRLGKLKQGETVVFSWIVYKSPNHRDRANIKVMEDLRIKEMRTGKALPFAVTRMADGEFEVVVEA